MLCMWLGSITNIPDDWFICNGSTFSISLYPKLYKALNNSNVLPDMITNNRFIRSSSTAGVVQSQMMRAHKHASVHWDTAIGNGNTLFGSVYMGYNVFCDRGDVGWHSYVPLTNDGTPINGINFNAGVEFGTEIRPYNISAIPIIKHD